MRFWLYLRRAALVVAALLLVAVGWDVATYDSARWRADFARVKDDMAQGYANLDWAAERRGIDLRQLDERTGAAIDTAGSRVRAFLALRRFLNAFGDPHVRLERSSGPPDGGAATRESASETARPADRPAGADCAAAGYEEGDHGFLLPFERLPGWRLLEGRNFPAGLAGRTGILRIAQFGEDQYLSVCERLFRPRIGARALQLEVRRALQEELRASIAALRRAGATRLLVDIGGNGGGTEWVGEAVALFTPRPMQRQAARRVGPACDRRSIWRDGRAPCPIFAPMEEPARIDGSGDWPGPLVVLTDAGTASSAEDFAAWIRDNGAGTLVGARTAGAGCGYVNGGTRTRLTVLPLDVRMPNCARFLRDGNNEMEGVPPHVAIPMGEPEQAVAALARFLGT